MYKIVLTGGGTAGHCTPNVALLPYLKKSFNEIHYIGSINGIEKEIITKEQIPYHSITTVKFDRSSKLSLLKIPFRLIRAVKEAKKILLDIMPNVIFSKGGYVSVPVVIAGYLLKIPIISHESDLTMGLANKTTAKFCNKILTTFPETSKKFKNSYHVGPPLRKSLFNQDKSYAKKYFNIKTKKPILLITGGSQGAKTINDCIRKDLDNLLKHFEIIHLCGKNNLDTSVKNKHYHQIEYLDRIELAYSIADVCVTRGGSNTLFELISLKIPCLIIPLPKGNSRGDQIVNAQYFCNRHMANVLYQENISQLRLRQKILQTYKNKEFYAKNIEKNKIKDGCPLINKIILENVK